MLTECVVQYYVHEDVTSDTRVRYAAASYYGRLFVSLRYYGTLE